MKAALYIRVSSMGQVRDGYSLEFQEQILREFCEREGHAVIEVYRDGGASGANTQRKELQRLIEDAQANRFDLVLIFRVDRFSRDPVDLLALVRTLENSRIKLRSVTEAVDASDPAGELMLTILGAIGKFVRANIIQNAMLGKTSRAQSGKYTGGKVPFGYLPGEDGRYVTDEAEWVPGISKADLIRKAFELYLESFAVGRPGMDYVIQWMESHGVPSPDGVGWTKTTISQWFRNPVYTGSFTYGKISQPMGKQPKRNSKDEWIVAENSHPAIVPQDLFDRVQELKEANRVGGRKPAEGVKGGLLTGFAVCADCGSSLSFRSRGGGRYRYYVCGSMVNDSRVRRGTTCEGFPYITADDLESLVWERIDSTVRTPGVMEELMAQLQAGAAPQLEALQQDIDRFKDRMAELEDEEMLITTAYAKKKLPAHLWEKQMERLEQERARLVTQLRQAENEIGRLKRHPAFALNADQVVTYTRRLFKQDMSFEDKRAALALVLYGKGVRVHPDGRVYITMHLLNSEVSCALDLSKLYTATRPSLWS